MRPGLQPKNISSKFIRYLSNFLIPQKLLYFFPSLAVLQVQESSGIDDIGTPIWKLAGCVAAVYLLLYLSLFKGVKSSGKVVWVTALAPYVLLSILLIRGLMLPGAMKGIHFYLVPDLQKLTKTEVWTDAAVQIFYSCGAGFGVHLAYASYNKFDNNCYR